MIVCKWPLEDGIKLSLHDDKKRHVSAFTNTPTQDVITEAHLVPIATVVKWRAEDEHSECKQKVL